MSIPLLPNEDISVKEIMRIAGLKGKLRKRVDTLELKGFLHSILCMKDEQGKEVRVSTNSETRDIEILIIQAEEED